MGFYPEVIKHQKTKLKKKASTNKVLVYVRNCLTETESEHNKINSKQNNDINTVNKIFWVMLNLSNVYVLELKRTIVFQTSTDMV